MRNLQSGLAMLKTSFNLGHMPEEAEEIVSQTRSAGTGTSVAFGDWTGAGNITASDNVYSQAATAGRYYEGSVQLVVNGAEAGNDKAQGGALPLSDAYLERGGSDDVWGCVLTPAIVNANNFGLSFQGKDVTLSVSTGVLRATNFGFTVPANAIIVGVVARIECRQITAGKSTNAMVDHIELTVHYMA